MKNNKEELFIRIFKLGRKRDQYPGTGKLKLNF